MRSLFASVLLLFLLVFVAGCNGGGGKGGDGDTTKTDTTVVAKKTYIRYNAYSPKGQEMVASMKIALAKMRNELKCDDVTSWYYQGGIHWPPGPSADLQVPNPNPLCESYNGTNAKPGWAACTHALPMTDYAYHIHFVVWHRMYLWYIEKIMRKYSGNPDFAIPYWPYCEGSEDSTYRTIMDPFRADSTSSLYTLFRRPSLNAGKPFEPQFVKFILDTVALFANYSTPQAFCWQLESGIHNNVHNYTGGYGNGVTTGTDSPPSGVDPLTGENADSTYGWMTNLTSAYDPIFWPHHSEIDRLWMTWNSQGPNRDFTMADLDSFPNKTYLFWDENGVEHNHNYAEVLEMTYNLDYIYDTQIPTQQATAMRGKFFHPNMAQKESTVAELIKSVALGNGTPTKVSVPNLNKAKFNLWNSQNTSGEVLFLNLTLSYSKKPKGGYLVFLNLPKGEEATPSSKSFVGHVSFFGTGHDAMGHDHGGSGRTEEHFLYEIQVPAQATEATLKAAYDLSFLGGVSTKNDLKIEKIQIVRK